jgi:threonine/homoserine/homoserine lactone efflux protein
MKAGQQRGAAIPSAMRMAGLRQGLVSTGARPAKVRTRRETQRPIRKPDMPPEYWTATFIPLLLFAVSGSFTPGPNVLMIAASGANFGWRTSLPLYWGVVLGFCFMMLAVALGLGTLFERWPPLHTALKFGGAAYMVWLGLRIATTRHPAEARKAADGEPIGFVAAALFQWVNPKAWIVAVGAVAAFSRPDLPTWLQAVALTAVFGACSLMSCALYLGSGVAIGRFLASPLAFRIFNLFMGGLTIASVALLFV